MKFFLNLTIVLLAMLSVVNAFPHLLQKGKPEYTKCGGLWTKPIPPLNVKNQPESIKSEEPVTFKVSGKLEKDITPDYKLQIGFYYAGKPIADPTVFEICDKLKCPIKAGKEFKLEKEFKAPKLPDEYDISVEIFQIGFDDLGCEIGTVRS